MMIQPELPAQLLPAGIEGLKSLAGSLNPEESRRDLTLCDTCLQWTVDGHQCYRPTVCEIQPE